MPLLRVFGKGWNELDCNKTLTKPVVTALKIAPGSLAKGNQIDDGVSEVLVYMVTAGNYFILLRVGFYYTRSKAIKLAKSSSEQEVSWDEELCLYVSWA